MVSELAEKDFQQLVLNVDTPVLVDFWAPWCGPCRAIAPVVEELSKDYENKVTFYKMNVDENPTIPAKYSIRAIPTIIVFKGTEILGQLTGSASKGSLKNMIQSALG